MRLRAKCLSIAASVALAATTVVGGVAGAQTTKTGRSRSVTVARGLIDPGASLLSSGLYVLSTISDRPGATKVSLRRVNASTGKVEARVQLGAEPESLTETGGALWFVEDRVIKDGATTATLLEALNPITLQTEKLMTLPAVAAVPALVAAGGNLWIADGSDLVRVSPSNGSITKTITAASSDGPHAIVTGIATDPRGRSLVTSIINRSGIPRIQRRNSHTGTVELRSAKISAVAVGHLSVYDNGVWASIATGTLGYVQRLSLTTLAPTGPPLTKESSNGVTGQVFGGVLYVTDSDGTASNNYCGNARTGRSRASLPAVIKGELLTANASTYYYVPSLLGTTHRIVATAVPVACH